MVLDVAGSIPVVRPSKLNKNVYMKVKKLYRSRDEKMITGLAAGIAKYFGIDPTLVRIAFVLGEFATIGLLFIGYLIIALIVPNEPIIT